MTHPFGDLIAQHLSRKHGLSQNKLAYGIDQDPAIVSKMCRGKRLTGPQARERVLNIIRWFWVQEVLATQSEANALLEAAGMSGLDGARVQEADLLQKLAAQVETGAFAFETPSIPDPISPPDVADFVGREAELRYFADKLRGGRMVVITGMPGVGKTHLTAKLARQMARPDQIFWYTFHRGESSDNVLWKLAEFLAWHGQDGLWRMVAGAQRRRTDLPPAKVLYGYLMQMLRRGTWLLCFDDFQHINEEPQLHQLTEDLAAAADAGELSLIIASRRLPAFVRAADFSPLGGLTFADTLLLLADRGVHLADEMAALLHERTQGNVQLLTLALAALQQASHPAHLLESLTEVTDIEHFLIAEVERGLTQEERAVMFAAAVLRDYAATRPAIEAIWDGGSARKPLHNLGRCHLLSLNIGPHGREYVQHPIVQAFYYDLLGHRQRRVWHSRAGEYFEGEGQDALNAARHFVIAGKYERAVRLIAATDLQMWFNQGRAQALRQVLERALGQALDSQWRSAAGVALGQTYAFLGEYEQAAARFERALAESEPVTEDGGNRRRAADLARRIGRMYGWRGEFERAHAFMRQAWEVLSEPNTDADKAVGALIHTHTGSLYYLQKQFAQAAEACGKALALLAEQEMGMEGAMAYQVLGAIGRAQGDWWEAARSYERSREVWERLADRHHLALLSDNIGNLHFYRGEFEQAEACYRRSLDFWQEVGAADNAAYARLNLGSIYLVRQAWRQAEAAYREALAVWQRTGNTNVAMAHNNLGLLALARGAEDEALVHFRRSIAKAPDAENRRGLAEALLRQGDVEAAAEQARQSLALAQASGMLFEEGMTLRTLGRIALVRGEETQARGHLESSKRILERLGAGYELGRTEMELERVEFLAR